MKDIILRTNNLTKKYKDFTALNNANITINKGDIYGLIGRNGAGTAHILIYMSSLEYQGCLRDIGITGVGAASDEDLLYFLFLYIL